MTVVVRDARVAAVVAFFEGLTPQSLEALPALYAADAYFRDPFNEVRGAAAIRHVFEDMFTQLADCRFDVRKVVQEGDAVFLTWDFNFRFRRLRPEVMQTIHGASHLELDPAGRIVWHRDYWDAAEELYAKLPVLGRLMGWLRRRMRAAGSSAMPRSPS